MLAFDQDVMKAAVEGNPFLSWLPLAIQAAAAIWFVAVTSTRQKDAIRSMDSKLNVSIKNSDKTAAAFEKTMELVSTLVKNMAVNDVRLAEQDRRMNIIDEEIKSLREWRHDIGPKSMIWDHLVEEVETVRERLERFNNRPERR